MFLLQNVPRHTRLLHLHEALRLMFQGRQLIGKQPAGILASSQGQVRKPGDKAASAENGGEMSPAGETERLPGQQLGEDISEAFEAP